MNKQFVERVQNWEKAYLTSVCKMIIRFYSSLAGSESTLLLFKEQGQKEVENGFLNLSYNILKSPNGHVNYQREMFISCIPTLDPIYMGGMITKYQENTTLN